MAGPNIFLFVPNIIGFARVILVIASLFYMTTDPYMAMGLYWSSAFLDVFDGMAARKFDQSTLFGAVLDMVSDRTTTLCLMMTCIVLYPSLLVPFQLLAMLDISSHWLQMYSSMLKNKTSHKMIDLSENALLRYYYMKPILFTLCSANELFFMGIYLDHFNIGWQVNMLGQAMTAWRLVAYVSFPLFAIKHLVGVVQLITAAQNIAMVDRETHAKKHADKST
eukprot:TRINITY_DN5673_c0_g1_i1.p1 TRINITY_DN5673_c0_g1~~TRINITY_DN5673_c0_g1_i1.p1  ORF type:complete len:222 (+),score=41.41 TRINITY_DN5673_c0_g1_i1:85-750(+)